MHTQSNYEALQFAMPASWNAYSEALAIALKQRIAQRNTTTAVEEFNKACETAHMLFDR